MMLDSLIIYVFPCHPMSIDLSNVQLNVVPPLSWLSICACLLPSLPSLLPRALYQRCSFLLDFLLSSFLYYSLALKTDPIKRCIPPPPSSFPSSLLNTIWSFDVSIVISRSAFVSTSYRVSAFTAPAPATATTFSCSRFSFFPLLTNLF